ncbi:MAG TPA: AI-2E family transporter [Sedimentisphaerales bacterium]|nr:AI-2E family transporter [Sedimentisphaerales bacterium]HRS10220.1 AI-2E family transporter [Sedimentisphaerales bacterium]HRV46926.1 AI-2E family transporter [Sedimentisphaerales bacterium]
MLRERREQTWLTTVSLVILAAVALAAALIYTRAVMIPFVVALFIVALVSPVEDFLVKRLRLPRVIAILVTLLVVMAVTVLVFLLIAQATTIIVSTAGEYSASFAYMADKILEPIEYLYREEAPPLPAAPNDGGPSSPTPPPSEPEPLVLFPIVQDPGQEATLGTRRQTDDLVTDANGVIDPNQVIPPGGLAGKGLRIDTKRIVVDMRNYIFNIVTNAFGTILGLISSMFFVIIFVIFLLMGRDPYSRHSPVYTEVVQKIRRYVGIKLVVSAVTGLLVWAILTFVRLELAAAFAILAFLLNFIPSIGSIIATLLPIPIAVVQFQSSPWLIVLVVIGPGAVQNILGNIIEPKLQGEGLNLHPVTVILALSFWGLLWGIVGMFLAAPITAALRIFLMQYDTLKPLGRLLAGDLRPTEKPSAS